MRSSRASFRVRLLGPNGSDKPDVDRALDILVHNTPPRLRTDPDQIREKIASPNTSEGYFYFAALYRDKELIGFAMLGYYPRCRLVVVDHMVIDSDQRGDAAFFIFTELISKAMADRHVDYIAIEVELETAPIASGASGNGLVRLLGLVGFGRVQVKYSLPSMDTRNLRVRYKGALMLKSMHGNVHKLEEIRREELENIVNSIFFDHYFPWYRDFLGNEVGLYKKYLETLFREFKNGLRKQQLVAIDGMGKESAQIITARPSNLPSTTHLVFFAIIAGIVTLVIYVLQVPFNWVPVVLVALVAVYAGFVAVSTGRAFDVLKVVLPFLNRNKNLRDHRTSKDENDVDQPNVE
jgi:hypothetical protein